MTFREWVRASGGPERAAKRLNTNGHRVRTWLRCEATPNYKLLVKIVKLSEGKVTLETIVHETNRGRK